MDRRRNTGCGCGLVLFALLAIVLIAALGAWRLGYIDRLLYESNIEHITGLGSASESSANGEDGDQGDEDASAMEYLDEPYVYSTLSEDDRAKYRIVYEALSTRDVYTYPETDMEDLARIRDCVLADHPELFSVIGVRQLTTTNTASGLVTDVSIEGQFSHSAEEADALLEQVDAAVDECLAGLPDGTDDYGKAKYAYEYLVDHTVYDHDAVLAPEMLAQDGAEAETAYPGQTIVDVFVYGHAVCGGYASAFQYLMQKLGIPCAYVIGEVNNGRHAWCLALLDGDYYYIDPTWGDPQFMGDDGVSEQAGAVNYDYLAITTEDLSKTHTISDLFAVPECTATADNYYVREDLLFDWPDVDRFGALAAERLAAGSFLQIRCTDEETYRDLLDNTVTTGTLAYYIEQDSYRYTHSDNFLSISVFNAAE